MPLSQLSESFFTDLKNPFLPPVAVVFVNTEVVVRRLLFLEESTTTKEPSVSSFKHVARNWMPETRFKTDPAGRAA